MPSLTAYSCWQHPQTSLPFCTLVSISNVCRSFSVCDGSFSSVIRSSASGACSGRLGRPSCDIKKISHESSFVARTGGHRTSCEIVFNASQLILGSMFWMSSGLISVSTCSSSASFGWRGKAAGSVLQVLRAQQRKLRVRSFIFARSFFLDVSSGFQLVRIAILMLLCRGGFVGWYISLGQETLRPIRKRRLRQDCRSERLYHTTLCTGKCRAKR